MTSATRDAATRLLALAAVLLLAACGGTRDDAPTATATSAARLAAVREAPQSLQPGWFERNLVLFDEVQFQYPQWFGNLGSTQTFGAYTYRHDPQTQNTIAYTATDIVLMGPLVNSLTTPVPYATLASFCTAPETARLCGSAERRTLVVGGLEREFIVYLPWRARQSQNLPVVFMLHGTSGTGAEFYRHSGWREVADAEGFIAVFPTALRHCFYEDDITVNGVFDANERRTPTKWASGILGDAARMPLCTEPQRQGLSAEVLAAVDHPLADDLGFFDAMMTDLRQNFSVDDRRVYVAGFSNGAQMAGRLAIERSTVVASGAGAAGPAWQALPPAARPLSFVFTVGELDDRFTAPLAAPALPLTDVGTDEAFKNVLVRPHVLPQQISDSVYTYTATTLYGTPVSLYTYADSTAVPPLSNAVYVAIISGLYHQYPNGINHPVKMAELLWSVFRTQTLP